MSQCEVLEKSERCPKPAHSRGWCATHYSRWQRNKTMAVRERLDLTDEQFGRLTARKRTSKYNWECECECGAIIVVHQASLRRGATKSCGCLTKDNARKIGTHTDHKISHGLAHHPMYPTWHNMWSRCTDPKNNRYSAYGARGIYVDERWADVRVFIDWGERNGWQPGYNVHRKHNDGPYSPENCQVLTVAEHQAAHRITKTDHAKSNAYHHIEHDQRSNHHSKILTQ